MKKRNLASKIMTSGLAAAMVLSMSMPVWAVEGDSGLISTGNPQVNKTITMAKSGVTVPAATYTFKLAATDGAPAQDDVTITSAGTETNSDGTVTLQAADLFKVAKFTKAGQYTYTVTEDSASLTDRTLDTSTHVLSKDSSSYSVTVRVENIEGTLTITGAVATKTGETAKANSVTFNNTYTEYANDDGDGSNPENNGLVVEKAVTGTGADKTNDEFSYTIDFTADSANSSISNPYSVTSSDNNSNTTGAITGSSYRFKLKDGQKIAFKLPAGTTYKITEAESAGYSVSAIDATADGGDLTATTNTTARTVEAVAGEKANTVKYTNNKPSNPLTGIVNNYGGLIAVVAIAAGGMVILTLRRKRDA